MESPLPHYDWTVDPQTGRANSSEFYNEISGEVARLIRDSAFDIVNGHIDRIGTLIVAQLAHVHHMIPSSHAAGPALLHNTEADFHRLMEALEHVVGTEGITEPIRLTYRLAEVLSGRTPIPASAVMSDS